MGHARTPEEGLGYDGGGMDHMQAQGGGLERQGPRSNVRTLLDHII